MEEVILPNISCQIMAHRNAFILGASGEVGKELLRECMNSDYFHNIFVLTRRDLGEFSDKRVQQKIVDFDKIHEHADVFKDTEYGFCCLGTTRGKSGAKGFYKVDHDYVVNSAKVAKENGCRHFSLVSSAGANKNSFFLYPQTKGQTEEDLKELHFEKLSIFQPALLISDRKEWHMTVVKPVTYMFPTAISVQTTSVAKAMLKDAMQPATESAVSVFSNKDIHRMAAE